MSIAQTAEGTDESDSQQGEPIKRSRPFSTTAEAIESARNLARVDSKQLLRDIREFYDGPAATP